MEPDCPRIYDHQPQDCGCVLPLCLLRGIIFDCPSYFHSVVKCITHCNNLREIFGSIDQQTINYIIGSFGHEITQNISQLNIQISQHNYLKFLRWEMLLTFIETVLHMVLNHRKYVI
jgi:hypothetical protein